MKVIPEIFSCLNEKLTFHDEILTALKSFFKGLSCWYAGCCNLSEPKNLFIMGTLAKTSNGLKNDVPSFFGNFFNTDWMNNPIHDSSMLTVPPLNIHEASDSYEIELAAPGFNKTDFKVELNNQHLTIMVEKSENQNIESDKKVQKREFRYEAFKRSILLPFKRVEENDISATYEHGILKIQVMKPEEMKEKPPKTILVK